MEINKKDKRSLKKDILLKAYEVLSSDIFNVSVPLNIDRDVRSVRLNGQYRLIFRQSTKKECRVMTHNDYNKLISNKNVFNIQ
jgi:hypothetical protein